MAIETKHTFIATDTREYLDEVSAFDATLPRESTYGAFYYGVSLVNNKQAVGGLVSFAKQLEGVWKYTRTLKSVNLQLKQRSIYCSTDKVGILLKGVWVPVSHRLPVNVDGTKNRTYLAVDKVVAKPIVHITKVDLEKIGMTDEDYAAFLVDRNTGKLTTPMFPCTVIDLKKMVSPPYIFQKPLKS